MQLKNKKVLLTGASGGIGQAVAQELAKHGAKLILIGRDEEKLQQFKQSIEGDHYSIVADINLPEGREEIVLHCQKISPDILINAAGVMDFNLYEKQDENSIKQMISTNLLSPMLLCQRIIPILQQSQEAAIVNIGSIFGSIGHPGFTAYCASKFGLRGFTEALQRELADSSIKVFYLAPRATKTDFNPDTVTALNEALGNTTDSPKRVAQELINVLSGRQIQRFMGWPEKLFVQINAIFPGVVHNALVKKLPIVKQFAQQQ